MDLTIFSSSSLDFKQEGSPNCDLISNYYWNLILPEVTLVSEDLIPYTQSYSGLSENLSQVILTSE